MRFCPDRAERTGAARLTRSTLRSPTRFSAPRRAIRRRRTGEVARGSTASISSEVRSLVLTRVDSAHILCAPSLSVAVSASATSRVLGAPARKRDSRARRGPNRPGTIQAPKTAPPDQHQPTQGQLGQLFQPPRYRRTPINTAHHAIHIYVVSDGKDLLRRLGSLLRRLRHRLGFFGLRF